MSNEKTYSVGIISNQVNCNFAAWTQWLYVGNDKSEMERVYNEAWETCPEGSTVYAGEDLIDE